MNDRPSNPENPRPAEEPELVLTIENAIEDRMRALRQLMRKKQSLAQADKVDKNRD